MKRSGKHIDDIFREKLQEGEKHVDYRESDWEALEKRLGRNKPVVWIRILGGAAAILAGLAFWLFYDAPSGEDRSVTRTEEQTQESPGEIPRDSAEEPARSGEPDSATPPEHVASAQGQEDSRSQAPGDPGAAYPEADPQAGDPAIQELRTGLQAVSPARLITGIPASVIHPRLNHKQVREPAGKGTGELSGKETGLPPGQERFTLSVLAAPAVNGVGSFRGASAGGDAGLLLTARLGRKWSISTGAVYSKKTYGTGPDQYNPARYYEFPAPVERIDADCRVLDIPLNIHYTLLEKNRNRITLGTGLSSYLMLREDYTYLYEGYGQEPGERSLNNENQHWFSVLNLQASYQRQLNSDLSIGLQPFLKLPVNDIGYGRVKLRSAGIAVQLNWNLPGKRP